MAMKTLSNECIGHCVRATSDGSRRSGQHSGHVHPRQDMGKNDPLNVLGYDREVRHSSSLTIVISLTGPF